MKIFVVTRSYPAPGDLYKYPFVHRRVLAYRKAGHDVLVFRPSEGHGLTSYDYEGVTCWSGGGAELARLAAEWGAEVVAAHGFSEAMWNGLSSLAPDLPVRAWLHGSEIPDFMRRKVLCTSGDERADGLERLRQRSAFWDRLLGDWPRPLKLVFVSNASVEMARADWGDRLLGRYFDVIPNPVDTDLFDYRGKAADDRFRILFIRPFDSPTYANDLAVEAILDLCERPGSDRLQFTLIGDGPLYDETLQPLRGRPNVTLSRRFLRQDEIVEEHRRNGIFLVPTRLDTQGLSRDEAMASGLVPVTNAIPAVCEFVDGRCAALAPPDDPHALACELWAMIEDPALFLSRSEAAAASVRADRSNERIIPRELALLESAISETGIGGT